MTSFHERFFKRRPSGFYPKGPKARRFALVGLIIFIAVLAVGLVMMSNGHRLIGQVILGGLVVAMIIYNGFVSTRSDL